METKKTMSLLGQYSLNEAGFKFEGLVGGSNSCIQELKMRNGQHTFNHAIILE